MSIAAKQTYLADTSIDIDDDVLSKNEICDNCRPGVDRERTTCKPFCQVTH